MLVVSYFSQSKITVLIGFVIFKRPAPCHQIIIKSENIDFSFLSDNGPPPAFPPNPLILIPKKDLGPIGPHIRLKGLLDAQALNLIALLLKHLKPVAMIGKNLSGIWNGLAFVDN